VVLGRTLDERAVLFPCTDNSVLLASRHREALAPWFHLALPAADVVELLVDKARFYPFARDQGFRVPATCVLPDREALDAAASRLAFPCIVKPALKTAEWRESVPAKAFRVGSPEALRALHAQYGHLGTLIAQEWIEGNDTDHYTCNAYFGVDSRPLVTFTSRKLRQWPPTGGEGCLSEEVQNERVRQETIRLFQRAGHRGLGYVEVKQDPRSGEYVILEPNVCRPTGRSAQAEAAGVELLYTQYCDVLGRPLPENREQSFRGVKWIHYRRDLQSSLHHWRRGELTLGEWARSWRGPKQDALFSLRDPVPFFADLTRAAFKVRGAEARGRPG
jgi:predicted ATP-grasp superfamily ATP-dependent carboligase